MCLPKTGQKLCYKDNGTETDCAGTGQDGDVQAGIAWPNPRFVDNGDDTVTDSLTGLEWTKNANLAGGSKTWQEALDYVKTLSTGGHSDWRLSNARELRSLADYSKYNPALPQDYPFTNVQSDYYWSSTSFAVNMNNAWFVDMDGGYVSFDNKSNYGYVWPVRLGQCGAVGNSTTTTTAPTSTTVPATTTSVISSTTTTACPATQVLETDTTKLENLRNFRDSKLAQSAVGRKIIVLYYHNAGSIKAAFDRSPALRAVARRALEVVAAMTGRKE